MAGIIEVKDQGVLRIYDADNSNYVDIVVPSTVSSNRTITIPDATFTIPQETNATHTGEVTGSGALTIADDVVDEANLKVSNSPTNGYALTAQSGNTGGLTWAAAGLDGWSSNSGNLLPADASKGIYLGVNSATASNLLNDFEFGTWTPALAGSPSGSYTYQFGNYTKINKMVFFTAFLQGNFSGGSGNSMITGLPFTPSDGADNVYYEPVTIGFTYGLGETIYQGFVQQNATELFLLKEPSGGARVHSSTSSLVSSDMRISISGFYNTTA
nr:hypothetical protein [uncultured Mediterranean phage uvMED]